MTVDGSPSLPDGSLDVDAELAAAGARIRLAAGSGPDVDPATDLSQRWTRRRRRTRRAAASAAATVLLVGGAVLASGAVDRASPPDSVRTVAPPDSVDGTSTTRPAAAPEPGPTESTSPTATTSSVPNGVPATTVDVPDASTTVPPPASGSGSMVPLPSAPPATTTTVPARPVIVITVLHEGRPFGGASAYVPGTEKITDANGRAVFEVPAHWPLPETYEVGVGWKDPDPYVDPSSPFNGCYQWWNSYERILVTEDGAAVTIDLNDFAWADCPESA